MTRVFLYPLSFLKGRLAKADRFFIAKIVLTAHYKYVYDGQGNIVRSIDMVAKKEYNYYYEDGKIMRATECDITLDGEIVIAKALVNSVFYSYDEEDRMTQKRIVPAVGAEQVIYYENNEDNTIVKFKAGAHTVTSHSKSDSFGRKIFDELQIGTGFVSRQFSYHAGEVTEEHKENAKLKSSATTQLVSQIVLSGGRTISYEYDAEERITKVVDSVDGTTEYTYDALGQLLAETHDGEVVNEMTYDNYGNILRKNNVQYSYDEVWKDRLICYNGTPIEYDAQGNPTNYLGHRLTWEKGRQLKTFDGNTYTYNANGIRTSKIVNGVQHTYTLDGTKILREEWCENTLIPLYDNEDSVCGIIYNNIPYYFQKNLQGDIIAIVDKDAEVVAKYSYDAWGVCSILEDVSGINIARINPFRYRGYYFDEEIGLYYLQSRYYDPELGRFVNGDDVPFVATGADSIRTNLYSYCRNMITNYDDQDGRDAVWVQASKSVAKMGHTGLVFKYGSKWYYWYWGIHPKAAIWGYLASLAWSLLRRCSLIGAIYRVASTTVLATCKLQVVSNKKTITQKEARDLANRLYDSSTKFDKSLYIKGNFDNAYYYFRALNITRNYNLLYRNCMQTTVDGLYTGRFSANDFSNHLRLTVARAMIVPNFAYSYMDRFF